MWTADSTVITADSMLATADGSAEAPAGIFVGGPAGASRGRMIRRRKRDELDLEPPPPSPSPPDLKPPALAPAPPPLLPPQPSLMASLPPPKPAPRVRFVPPDEEEDEIALLLELIS